jgi:hypothetical protein
MRLVWSTQEQRTGRNGQRNRHCCTTEPLIGPRMRLPQSKDVSDLDVCRAVAASKAYLEARGENGPGPIRFADSFIMEWTGVPEKVAHAAMERAYDHGLIECGVSIRSGWLTDKGVAMLAKTGVLR